MAMSGQPHSNGAAPHRVVLLGASNLARGISTAVETAQRALGGPLEILSAQGHGRGYGLESSILGRRISAIHDCGIWEALRDRPPAPTSALVTDVGNDLVYGAEVKQVAEWLETCLDRLGEAGCRTTMTGLPLENLRNLSPWRFRIVQKLVYPAESLSFEAVIRQAEELDARVVEMAAAREIPLVRPKDAWFGWDPIHIRLRHWPDAWSEMLRPLLPAGKSHAPARGSVRRWLYLRSRVPAHRVLFGREQRREQPAGRLPDGTTVALY